MDPPRIRIKNDRDSAYIDPHSKHSGLTRILSIPVPE